MWRPNDWEELCKKYCPDMDRYDPDPMIADKAYEAGADAMLEGLKKHALNHIIKGKHEKLVEDGYITWENEQSGWIVFIPEDE